MKTRMIFQIFVCIALATGCYDDPQAVTSPTDVGPLADELPSTTARSAGQDVVGSIVDNFRHRLELEFSLVGTSGSTPIVVRLQAQAVEAITGGEVIVTFPTQAGLTYVGVGERQIFAQNTIPTVARWQLPSMSAGDTWTRLVTVGTVENGYYNIAVGIRTQGPDPGPFLVDDATPKAWVFVDEIGAHLTSVFGPSLFPERISPASGHNNTTLCPFRLGPFFGQVDYFLGLSGPHDAFSDLTTIASTVQIAPLESTHRLYAALGPDKIRPGASLFFPRAAGASG